MLKRLLPGSLFVFVIVIPMQEIFTYDPKAAGTKGLVYIGDKVLVYRRDNNTDLYPLHIDLPGGGPENQETPFQTFAREVREEFGLKISSTYITYAKSYPSSITPGKIAYFVVAKLPDDQENKITFGHEGTEYLLVELSDYLKMKDAWPVFQERAAEYSDSTTS
jgi:8-oxo-dGTP diphosphatase